jgi:IS605 OrfB family transposase
MNKVMRYQIIKPINVSWDILGQVLRDIRHDTSYVLNKAMQVAWEWNNFSLDYKKETGSYPNKSEVLGYKGTTTQALSNYYNSTIKTQCRLQSKNLGLTVQTAIKKFENDKIKILKGEQSIPSYKRDCPIFLDGQSISLSYNKDIYVFSLSLINTKYKKELKLPTGQFKVVIKAPDNSRRQILDRILSGQYKLSASQIIEHKGKWFINLCYGFEAQKTEGLDENNVLGVDLGINIAAYIAFNNSLDRFPILGGEIDQFRRQVERRSRELKKQTKFCGEGRVGHGTKTRCKPVEVTYEKISNFRQTTNHKYSKFIVEQAIKHNCGVIQMEDLTGISTDSKFLKNWTYYDLQQKVKYKAEEKGIKVIMIDPKYTSQRCSKCGYIHSENRPKGEKGQAYFKCIECEFETNADYNAAKNIATQDIEYIIKDQLMIQNKENLIKIS